MENNTCEVFILEGHIVYQRKPVPLTALEFWIPKPEPIGKTNLMTEEEIAAITTMSQLRPGSFAGAKRTGSIAVINPVKPKSRSQVLLSWWTQLTTRGHANTQGRPLRNNGTENDFSKADKATRNSEAATSAGGEQQEDRRESAQR